MKKFTIWSLASLAATVTSLLSAGAVQTPPSAAKDIQGSEQATPAVVQDQALPGDTATGQEQKLPGDEDQDEVLILEEEEEEGEECEQDVKDTEVHPS